MQGVIQFGIFAPHDIGVFLFIIREGNLAISEVEQHRPILNIDYGTYVGEKWLS